MPFELRIRIMPSEGEPIDVCCICISEKWQPQAVSGFDFRSDLPAAGMTPEKLSCKVT